MNTGTMIGDKYEIIKEIKRGGFGIVYKGYDLHLGKVVAIKAVDPNLLGDARNIDMFQQEAISVASLNHQNIVQIYDIKRQEDGQLFIIMEFIDGSDLLTILKICSREKRTLPTHMGIHIIAEVCNGLDYAHSRRDKETGKPLNFVHQDVSPVNIMVTKSGEIKIIDFGMAGLKRDHRNRGREVHIQGKINYMAPEQVNSRLQIDRRTDVFAAGLILYELLTGNRLIQASSPQEVLETLVDGSWDKSRLQDDDRIPDRLRVVLQKALQHNPKNRYPNANLMYKDLMHYLILTAPAVDFMSELNQLVSGIEPDTLSDAPANGKEHGVGQESKQAAQESTSTQEKEQIESSQMLKDVYRSGEQKITKLSQPGAHTPLKARTSETEPGFYSFVEDADEDDQRTIIDVVRLSARTHKRAIMFSSIGVIIASLLFVVADTFAHFTQLGTGIYDYLFPPAIKIVSVPPGAQVYLDDTLLPETAPLDLNEISPGVHKLMITLPSYEPIVKSINVPRKGSIDVSGEARRHASQPYILKFKNNFEITSTPSGADIYIDNVKIGQKTPATVFWDVTERPTEIRLERAGLPALGGLRINSLANKEIIDDLRIWDVKKIHPEKAQYKIKGLFHKTLTITSRPSRADIYLNDGNKPVGVTGLNGDLMLTLGTHLIALRKNGYLSRSFTVEVDEDSPEILANELLRTVRIFARDASAPEGEDLGARIVSIQSHSRTQDYDGETPAVLNLLPNEYTLRLEKDGYHPATVQVAPGDNSVTAIMNQTLREVTFVALDAITDSPVDLAKVTYKPERSDEENIVLGLTDLNGEIKGRLMPGFYEVTIHRTGYQQQKKSLRVRSEEGNKLTFRLAIAR